MHLDMKIEPEQAECVYWRC